MSERQQLPPELDVERLARMASVDGSWWQECDQQVSAPKTYWRHAVAGTVIGTALGYAAFFYALTS